jgi:hypothetical protein
MLVVVHNYKTKTSSVVARMHLSEAASYIEEFLEEYIYMNQGNQQPIIYSRNPPPLKYGFYVKTYDSDTWKIREVVRSVGYLWNSYEIVDHIKIMLVRDLTATATQTPDELHVPMIFDSLGPVLAELLAAVEPIE